MTNWRPDEPISKEIEQYLEDILTSAMMFCQLVQMHTGDDISLIALQMKIKYAEELSWLRNKFKGQQEEPDD